MTSATNRDGHNVSGVYLAIPLLNRLLPQVYDEHETMYEARGHILHCIYSHEFEVRPRRRRSSASLTALT